MPYWKTTPDDTKTVTIKAKVVAPPTPPAPTPPAAVKKGVLVLRSSLTEAEPGRVVTLYADVKNIGNVASSFKVDFIVAGMIHSKSVTSVPVGAFKRTTYAFNMPAATIKVDAKLYSEV